MLQWRVATPAPHVALHAPYAPQPPFTAALGVGAAEGMGVGEGDGDGVGLGVGEFVTAGVGACVFMPVVDLPAADRWQ